MIVKGYSVSFDVVESRLITYHFNDDLKTLRIEGPQEVIHPSLYAYFAKVCEDMLTNRTMLHDTVSYVVKNKYRDTARQSTIKVIARMIKEYGDLDDHKMRWDCNMAPKNHSAEGKYADLKAFIDQRKAATQRS